MNSPVIFILVALALSSAMLSVIFFSAWKFYGKQRHALSWSLAFFAATAQWTGNIFASSFPDYESYWLTVNALSLTTITLALRGHCQRTNCQLLPVNLWPYTCGVYAAIVWCTVFSPHVGARTAIVPFIGGISMLLAARMILTHRSKTRAAEWGAAVTLTLFGLSQIGAGWFGWLQGVDGSETYLALYLQVNFLTLPAGYIGTGMFVVFMMASDLAEEMKTMAVQDQLTGLLNRRGFNDAGDLAFATARRTDRPFSVIMTDIDRFKSINDDFGHAAGDQALCHFAELLRKNRRAEDILARIGGEEFAIVLPGTRVEESIHIAEELCNRLENSGLRIAETKLKITASFGVATISNNDESLADIFVRADTALYRSKRAGRNRVDLEASQLLQIGEKLAPA